MVKSAYFFSFFTIPLFLLFLFGLTKLRKSKIRKLKTELCFFMLFSLFYSIMLLPVMFYYSKGNMQNFKIAFLLSLVLTPGMFFILFRRRLKKNLSGSILFRRRTKTQYIFPFILYLLIFTLKELLEKFAPSGWLEGIFSGFLFGFFISGLFILSYVYKLEKKLGAPIVIQEE